MITTMAELQDRTRKRQADKWTPTSWNELQLSIQNVPTAGDVESYCGGLQRGKATGEDFLPPELLKVSADIIQLHLAPLNFKIATRLEEPLAWKG